LEERREELRDAVIGFADESSVECNPKKRRILGRRKVKAETTKKRKTIFGFMSLNGNDVAMISDSSKAKDFVEFMRCVRKENGDRKIVMIVDNAKTHKAKLTIEEAEKLDIVLIYLPPYSPDLNPIEFEWKDMKRELAKFLSFDEVERNAKSIAERLMKKRKHRYMRSWVEKFGSVVGLVPELVK
jgi:transposase